jgi:cell wall-associated NlpC family hydrolase
MAKKNGSGAKAAALVLGGLLVAHYMPSHGHLLSASAGAPSSAAVQAVAFAREQVRTARPYCWGGTGPSCFDCSGLVMRAYGWSSNLRTTTQQWAGLQHISSSQLEPGDLVFYAGSDGTASSPGHVVMYIGHGKVIQEFGAGYTAMVTPLAAVDAGPLTGYARPPR